jgi:hypothetical protein
LSGLFNDSLADGELVLLLWGCKGAGGSFIGPGANWGTLPAGNVWNEEVPFAAFPLIYQLEFVFFSYAHTIL